MAAISFELMFNGSTGKETSAGREYVALYRVFTDDANDQAGVILEYFRTNDELPWLGSVYEYGNDVDNNAVCQTVGEATRPDQHSTLWEVPVHFGPRGESEQQPGPNGEPTTNPFEWQRELEFVPAEFTKPLEKAIYRGGAKLKSHTELIKHGGVGPVRNSALVVFDPPLEIDDSRFILRFSHYLPAFPFAIAKQYKNAVNKDKILINVPAMNFGHIFPKYTLKAKPLGGRFQLVNGFKAFRISLDLDFDEDGWRLEALDRGVHARACPGDPDGKGGTFSNVSTLGVRAAPDPAKGEPQVRRMVDPDGVPITEPVMLDGNGQPLPIGDKPVYLTYTGYDELAFAPYLNALKL